MDTPERRKHQRYPLKKNILAILKPHPIKLGQIINISEGGLAFHYLGDDELPERYTELDIFVENSQSEYVAFPFIPVRDFIVTSLYEKSSTIRQLCIKFGNLNDNQKTELKHFIASYAQ